MKRITVSILVLAALALIIPTACSSEPPEDGVQVQVTNSLTEAQGDALLETLKRLDSNITTTMILRVGQDVTINLSPVSDVKAFADRITCGKVVSVSVEKRIIRLDVDTTKISKF